MYHVIEIVTAIIIAVTFLAWTLRILTYYFLEISNGNAEFPYVSYSFLAGMFLLHEKQVSGGHLKVQKLSNYFLRIGAWGFVASIVLAVAMALNV